MTRFPNVIYLHACKGDTFCGEAGYVC